MTCLLTPTSASADRRGVGTGIGIGLGIAAGAAILNDLGRATGAKARPQRPTSRSRPAPRSSADDDDDDDDSSSSRSSRGKSAKAAEDRAADARNHAAQMAEIEEIKRTERLEQERNVQRAIRDFANLLDHWHKWLRDNSKANVKVSTGASINQVTEGEIRRSVEDAYKVARLHEFERMAGEVWTRDRLTVRVLDHSRKELAEYFRGVGVKGASMDDLRQVFERSAKHVYAHALQVSEMIGVSHSFDRFIRTIFEHSDQVEESLSTIGADGRYERIVEDLVNRVPRQTFVSESQALATDPLGLERQFLFRFRARRVLYDCMSARYSELAAGGSAGQPIQISTRRDAPADTAQPAAAGAKPDMWKRMSELVGNNCREPLGSILAEAKDGRMQPRPARWDSSGSQGGVGPVLLPTSGQGHLR
jgi:hypothetical protein